MMPPERRLMSSLRSIQVKIPTLIAEDIAMPASTIKEITLFTIGSRMRAKNRIYEAEFVALLENSHVDQIIITCIPTGYWVAVLPDKRVEIHTRSDTTEKVVSFYKYSYRESGYLTLYATRNKRVRVYRSLDTLVTSLRRFGPLPTITIREGKK
jgi:hypothetical protein